MKREDTDPDKDIEIPEVWDDETPDVLTVSRLIRECREDWEERSAMYLARAQFNERMVLGEQFIDIGSDGEIRDLEDWPDHVRKTKRNHLRNLSLTWTSRILEDAPWVKCWPSEPGVDQAAAEVANDILDNCKQLHDFDDMSATAAERVQHHTAVGIKAVWDPLIGPPSPGIPVYDEASGLPRYDENGEPVLEGKGEPLGDVRWDLVTVFDYGTDGAENIEDSIWCFFERWGDEWEARSLLDAAGLEPKVDVEPYTDTWGVKREGVRITELWWRPGARFPKGLYCVQVGCQPVMAIPFPYNHHELPLAVWKCGARRGSPFGSSHVDDAVEIQMSINENVAALQTQSRQIASQKLIAPGAVIEAWENGNQMVAVEDEAQARIIRYIEPPPRSMVLVQSLEDNEKALYTVYGLNEVLSGAENVKSGTSAKSIAYLNKLDSMKMSGASRSLNKMVVRLARQTLKLYQQFVQLPRLARITGDVGLAAAKQFVGADLAGVDVKIESASGRSQMRAEVSAQAQEQVLAGNMDPGVAEQVKTGSAETSFGRASRDIVTAQAEAALRGEPEAADPEVDPTIAINEISAVLAANQGHPGAMGLMALLQEYRSKLQPMVDATQPNPGEGPVLA